MFYLPSIPQWHGMHVLIVHFPIALLSVAPLFVLLAAIIKPARRGLAISALVLLVLGTIGAWLATASGGPAAMEALKHLPPSNRATIHAAIHHHADLGELTRDVFTILSILFFLLLLAPLFKKKIKNSVSAAALLIFFVLCLPGIFLLIDTGDAGAMLVHKYGLKADAFPANATLNTGEYTAANFEKEHRHHPAPATAPSGGDGDGD